jgi:hypothetical protein
MSTFGSLTMSYANPGIVESSKLSTKALRNMSQPWAPRTLESKLKVSILGLLHKEILVSMADKLDIDWAHTIVACPLELAL